MGGKFGWFGDMFLFIMLLHLASSVCVCLLGLIQHVGRATSTMEPLSPCTPPPKSPEAEPCSPQKTCENTSVDEKRWIRAHARDMEIKYRTWLAALKDKEDRRESMRYMTTHELAALDVCVWQHRTSLLSFTMNRAVRKS